MTKVYFAGLLMSLETGEVSPFFRHGKNGDEHIDVTEWAACQTDINVVQCEKIVGLKRKEATAKFHQLEADFKAGKFKRETTVHEEFLSNLEQNGGDIPKAVADLE